MPMTVDSSIVGMYSFLDDWFESHYVFYGEWEEDNTSGGALVVATLF